MGKEYDINKMLRDPSLFINHLILGAFHTDKDFDKHWEETVTGNTVEVKVLVNGYEVTCDSFQDAFSALWARCNEKEDESREELVRSFLNRKGTELADKMQDMVWALDYCDKLLNEEKGIDNE